jgi:hypothetical protein
MGIIYGEAAMSNETHAQAKAPQGPVCASCKVPMQVTGRNRHAVYAELDEWTYRCKCGRTGSRLAPHRGIIVRG